MDGLYKLKEKYRVSICLLVNVAIRNALITEKEEKNATLIAQKINK